MAVSNEERNRILSMVEAGQVSASEAAQLLDALFEALVVLPSPVPDRTLRVWVTDTATRSRKANMTATLPLGLLRLSLQALAGLIPALSDGRVDQVIRSLESGKTGRVMDLQNLEDGKRIEIFIE